MDYLGSLEYLRGLERLGIRFRLENTRELLSGLGFSYDGLVVHVAGTNGKGSCAAALASILTSSGKKTGLYTSPELFDFRERMRIDGEMISEEKFAQLTSQLRPLIDGMQEKPTFFEATTALALKHFADGGVDAMVLEAGMGGRLDSTNALPGQLSIITSVSLDHMAYLGDSISEIALEKAGIIWPRTDVVTCAKEPALSVIHRESIKRKAKIFRLGKEFWATDVLPTLDGTSFTLKTAADTLSISSPFAGDYQAENVSCAAVAAQRLGIGKQHILDGISRAKWQGRMQVMSKHPYVIVDCAHNPDGVERAIDFIKARVKHSKLIVVAGFSRDKDYAQMAERLGTADLLIATRYRGARSLEPQEILKHANGIACDDVSQALAYARSNASERDLILVIGSIYLAAEALKALS